MDVCLDNEVERIHAIKLIRKIAHVAPNKLSSSLVYPLVAIGNDGNHERDRMVRISLATICEIGEYNVYNIVIVPYILCFDSWHGHNRNLIHLRATEKDCNKKVVSSYNCIVIHTNVI